jgi:hypothetical protein
LTIFYLSTWQGAVKLQDPQNQKIVIVIYRTFWIIL